MWKELLQKRVTRVEVFRSISALGEKYTISHINPKCATEKELREVYDSFPGYKEKIKQHGLVALELE